MRLLRVYLDRGWDASRATPWVLIDAERQVDTQTGAAATWPDHDALEAVVSAGQVRILSIALPRLPPARAAAAARFALDDQIAGGGADAHVAISPQNANGTLLAIICPRALISVLAARHGPFARLQRVMAEPELALPITAYRWCRSVQAGNDFVRGAGGEAFGVSAPDPGGRLPPELALALTRSSDKRAAAVQVEWSASADAMAEWTRESGVPFVPGAAWQWSAASAQAFAESTDLLQGEFARGGARATPPLRRALVPAAWLVAAALVVHALGTVGEWTTQRIAAWRMDGEWTSLALAAGLPRDTLGSPAAARAALTKRHVELLHAQRRFARGDALPLLARASPVVASLPVGAIRRATYADRHWTLETNVQDPALLRDVERRLRDADLEALVVPAPGGARMRIGTPR